MNSDFGSGSMDSPPSISISSPPTSPVSQQQSPVPSISISSPQEQTKYSDFLAFEQEIPSISNRVGSNTLSDSKEERISKYSLKKQPKVVNCLFSFFVYCL